MRMLSTSLATASKPWRSCWPNGRRWRSTRFGTWPSTGVTGYPVSHSPGEARELAADLLAAADAVERAE